MEIIFFIFYCHTCDLGSFFNVIMKKHNETKKHKINLIKKKEHGKKIDF